MSSEGHSGSLLWHSDLSSLVYLLNLFSCHAFLSCQASFPLPFLLHHSLRPQMDDPPKLWDVVFWKYTLSFFLDSCICWSLCLEQLLHPTHTSSSTPSETGSFISETASPRKSPLIPQEGSDSPPLHTRTPGFVLPPEELLCSCI